MTAAARACLENQLTERAYGELAAGVAGTPACCLRAEVGAMLRLAATARLRSGAPVVEADFGTYPQAARLRAAITVVACYRPRIRVVYPGGTGQPGSRQGAAPRYVLDIGAGREAANLLLSTGLAVRPLVGMPRPAVAGNREDCRAAWRGAFLATGTLCSPKRARPVATVTCPTTEAALALTGLASRFGVPAQLCEQRGLHQAIVIGADAVTSLLSAIGAPATATEWRTSREAFQAVDPVPHNQGDLDGSNLSRSKVAATESAARARRSLEILGPGVPAHLQQAALLRIGNPEASISQLARMATPALTKDRMAGLLRRLFQIANERAANLGVANIEEAVLTLAAAS